MKQFRNTLRKYRLVLSAVCLVCVLLTGCSAAKETEGDTACRC